MLLFPLAFGPTKTLSFLSSTSALLMLKKFSILSFAEAIICVSICSVPKSIKKLFALLQQIMFLMEPYPIVVGGEIKGYVLSSSDITVVYDSCGRREKIILWVDKNRGVVINDFVRDWSIGVGEYRIDLGKWVEEMPILPFYTVQDGDSYARFLAPILKPFLEGKTVVAAFSGGKDSYATLYILTLMRSYVNFKLLAVYSYMPFLEPEENISIAEEAAKKLGVELHIVQPDKHILRWYLIREGLPYRRVRWCTYLKTRPMRKFVRSIGADFFVSADRLVEAGKRLFRLIGHAKRKRFVAGKNLRPTYMLTIFDVVKLCRESGYIHPDYLRGLQRVSCSYCPYKPLHEFSATRETGAESFLLDVMRREYVKWYAKWGIEEKDFVNNALWRYVPRAAKAWIEVMKFIERFAESGNAEVVDSRRIHEMFKSVWVEPMPKLPIKSFDEEVEAVLKWLESRGREVAEAMLER